MGVVVQDKRFDPARIRVMNEPCGILLEWLRDGTTTRCVLCASVFALVATLTVIFWLLRGRSLCLLG